MTQQGGQANQGGLFDDLEPLGCGGGDEGYLFSWENRWGASVVGQCRTGKNAACSAAVCQAKKGRTRLCGSNHGAAWFLCRGEARRGEGKGKGSHVTMGE